MLLDLSSIHLRYQDLSSAPTPTVPGSAVLEDLIKKTLILQDSLPPASAIKLPYDLLLLIIEKLRWADLLQVSLTCKTLRDITVGWL